MNNEVIPIKVGMTCKSMLYGEGRVVELYDMDEPYMFYPVVVYFSKKHKGLNISKQICFDLKGNTPRQQTDEPDAVFY